MRKSGTRLLPIATVLESTIDIKLEFLTPPMPQARVTQICRTCSVKFEETLRGRAEVQVAIILGSRAEVRFAHEGLECGSVALTVEAGRERARRTPKVERRKQGWRAKDAQAVFRKYLAQISKARQK